MMALTRTRSDEDSRVPTIESVAEGSASAITTRTNRRRKRGSTDTRAAVKDQLDKFFVQYMSASVDLATLSFSDIGVA
ncbi:hypothetical protein L1987_70768 [Smallanthus sonchifolius]|uniref:Uncharacterized protein n=1 Tax=Smallanthus sonchifolius TaxID=185202 RepID=A0ACB9APZ1_9ASTR|nr:hypothetical protein L1987_70768 [Smallanthus sonchifolius]